MTDQFERLRDGDRFWYSTYLPPELVQLVDAQSLGQIIRRNTSIGDELQPDVFFVDAGRSGGPGPGVPEPVDFAQILSGLAGNP